MRQSKPFKSINEQVQYLKENKQISFSDEESAKIYLLHHNYYNVISVAKVRFVSYFKDGKKYYLPSQFEMWQDYYEKDVILSKKLILRVADLEKEINSKLAYYLSEMIETGRINHNLKYRIKNIINHDMNNKAKDYVFSETWTYVTQSTFGTVVKIIDCLDKVMQKKILPKSFGIKSIKELKNLRNNLFHLTPLNIYLTTSKNTNQQIKQRRFSLVAKLLRDDETLAEVVTNCKRYAKIKENTTKVV